TLDTIAPTVAITSSGGLTNQATQTISGTVGVADAGSTVTILDGSTQIGTATVAANGSWSTNVTLSGQGQHTLTATDTDAAGNKGTSNAVVFTLPSIEAFGSTGLGQVGSNYFLYPNGGSAVELSYGGAPVVDGQFDQFAFGGHFVPIGAEQTASG